MARLLQKRRVSGASFSLTINEGCGSTSSPDEGQLDIKSFPNNALGSVTAAFNDVNQTSFKAKLVAAGYYTRWKAEFGETAWAALEKHAGKLA